jgi:hypothetical protein
MLFAAWLERTSVAKNNHNVVQKVSYAWNQAGQRVSTWPALAIHAPKLPRHGTPRSSYAESFLADLERFALIASGKVATTKPESKYSETDEGGQSSRKRRRQIRQYSDGTVQTRLNYLRRAAVLLATSRGAPVSTIVSLEDLVRPGCVQAIIWRNPYTKWYCAICRRISMLE